MNSKIDVSIIVPVYNEQLSLEALINKILKTNLLFTYEIIIIDSGSNDGSSEVIANLIEKFKIKSLKLDVNRGKGFAVRKGLEIASGEVILIQDADLEYEPSDYNQLINSISFHQNDFVLGSRSLFVKNWRIRKSSQFNLSLEIINIGSYFLTWIFCKMYAVKISDTQTMYKVFKKEIIKDLVFTCDGFDFDLELLGKLVLKGYIPRELPVQYNSRTAAEGKKLHFFKDGFQAIVTIFRVRLFS